MDTVTSVTIARPDPEAPQADRVAATRATITLSARLTSSSKVGATTVVGEAGRAAATMTRAHRKLIRRIGPCIGPMAARHDLARAVIRPPARVAGRQREAGR